jgi:hypothetical protein
MKFTFQLNSKMMKCTKWFLGACLVLMLALQLPAQGIRFEQGTFEQAQTKAALQKKMLMLVVCGDFLEVCEIMQNDIFTAKEVGDAYNTQFVCWQLDAKEIEGSPFFAGVRILSIPEFIFFDAQGNPQYREGKLKDHDQMLAMATAALNPQNHLSRLTLRYQAGDRDPAFVRRYIVDMDAAGQDMVQPSAEYLKKISREALLETENWIIATIGVKSIADGAFQYVLAHLQAFKKQFGEDAVHTFIVAAYRSTLAETVRKQDLAQLGECRKVVLQLLGAEAAQPVILQDELTFHAAGGNWVAYEKSARSLFAIYTGDDAGLYNEVAWAISQHSSRPDMLLLAEEWAQRSVEIVPAYWNCHTLATLQWQNKKPESALSVARQAMELAEPGTDEIKIIQELIQQIQK